ncbi:hypothetical protein [Actinophytocola sp.]|jgi:Mce-associated membrane protein|uniref:hypothetical protein n=1 Tax=Actinophytocola sp. TaxID=1872138 RepID=UPI002ED9DD63
MLVVAVLAVVGSTPAAARGKPANLALVDAAATQALVARATSLSEKLFSYDYRDLAGHERRVEELSTGHFKDRYRELFSAVLDAAPAEKLTLSSTVVAAAAQELTGDRAKVLAYLDQTATRGATGASTTGAAMFLLSLRQVDGQWLASEIDTFEGR